jgi:hypothetical protein
LQRIGYNVFKTHIMKYIVLVVVFIGVFSSATSAQSNYQPAKSSYRFGGGYARYSEENGFVVFNEAQFRIWKNFTAGPNLYFARSTYGLDMKNSFTNLYGVDLNLYYTVRICKSSSIQFGTGYGFRHKEGFIGSPYWGWESPVSDKSDMSQFIANFNIEKAISDRFNIGLKTSWQPMGTQEFMYYSAVFGSFVF